MMILTEWNNTDSNWQQQFLDKHNHYYYQHHKCVGDDDGDWRSVGDGVADARKADLNWKL